MLSGYPASSFVIGSYGQQEISSGLHWSRRCCPSTFLPYRPNPHPGRRSQRSEHCIRHAGARGGRAGAKQLKSHTNAIATLCLVDCLCTYLGIVSFYSCCTGSFFKAVARLVKVPRSFCILWCILFLSLALMGSRKFPRVFIDPGGAVLALSYPLAPHIQTKHFSPLLAVRL